MRWRARHTFLAALGGAFVCFLAFLAASLWASRSGGLGDAQARVLLGLLYWGTYPLVFVALAAMAWHYVRFYRGDYARR